MKKQQDPIIIDLDFDGKDVFEIGCGNGKTTFEHFQNAQYILGIDTNSEAIEYMKENWPVSQNDSQADFHVGNIIDFNMRGMRFDYVVFSKSF